MPGPSGRIVTFTPEPLQVRHGCIAPGLPPCLSTMTTQQHQSWMIHRKKKMICFDLIQFESIHCCQVFTWQQ